MSGLRVQRRQRWPRVVIGVLILLVTALDVAVIHYRGRATTVTFDDAVARYRDETALAAVEVPASTTTTLVGSTTRPDATTQPTDVTSTPAPSTTDPLDPSGPVLPTDTRPAGGVYRFATVGSEEVPFINARRAYPAETTATVTRGSGCGWHLRVDLIAEHHDDYELCSTGGAVEISTITISITWFGISQAIALTCAPTVPLLAPGAGPDVRVGQCRSSDITAEMRVTPGAQEQLVVGGTTVPVTRVTWVMQFGGRFEGTGTYALWLDPTTGFPLKTVRDVDAQGATPLGKQRYIEHHTTTLVDLEPGT